MQLQLFRLDIASCDTPDSGRDGHPSDYPPRHSNSDHDTSIPSGIQIGPPEKREPEPINQYLRMTGTGDGMTDNCSPLCATHAPEARSSAEQLNFSPIASLMIWIRVAARYPISLMCMANAISAHV